MVDGESYSSLTLAMLAACCNRATVPYEEILGVSRTQMSLMQVLVSRVGVPEIKG